MKIGLLRHAAFIFALTLGGAAQPANPMSTYRENKVYFVYSPNDGLFLKGQYIIKGFSITDGQDPDGKIKIDEVHNWSGNRDYTSYTIGRKHSTKVAEWFEGKIKRNQNTFNHSPVELNFAFIGTMILLIKASVAPNTESIEIKDIALAQGQSGSTNNWWFGGKTCSYVGSNTVSCDGTIGKKSVTVKFLRGGNSIDDIQITEIIRKS